MIIVREHRPDPAFLLAILVEAAYPPGTTRPSPEQARADPRLAQWLDDFGAREGDICIIGKSGEEPVGAAWCRVFDGHPAHGIVGIVTDGIPALAIAVQQEMRGKGLGGMMLDALCQEAQVLGYPAISLAVGATNPARLFYERHGFIATQTTPVIAMRKPLVR